MRYYIIFFIAFLLTSCNVEKRAANNFYRAVQLDKATVYNECGKIAPPINKEWDSTGYKQGAGEPEIVYVQVDCDSARLAQQSLHVGDTSKKPLYVKVPCPPCKPRVDTFFKFKTKELVNRATEYAQAAKIEYLTKSLNKSETALKVSESDRKRVRANNTKIGIIIAVYLAIKVLMMWLGTKLPVNGIFNVIRKIF